MDNPLRNGFRVGDWDVLPIEGQISGPGGKLHLEPKVMDVLVCLASNPGSVTERDAILEAVWGRTVVSDEPLTRCIATLRKSLGDDPKTQGYIQTVPKRGYRLVARVQTPGAAPESESGDEPPKGGHERIPAVIAGVAVLAAAALFYFSARAPDSGDSEDLVASKISSVAVLPFDQVGPADASPDIGRAFSADLVPLLSRVDGLQAKSMLYVDNLIDQGMSPIEIGNELAASHVLKGHVETEQDAIRLTIELIDAENGDVTFSSSYSDDIADLIRLQHTVVDNVAISVGVAPLNYAQERIRDVDPRAYRLYVKARQINDPTRADEITDALAEAIRYDPDFAEAHSYLALQYMVRGWASEDRFGPFLDTAISHATTAAELDAELVEARLILANIHALRYDWIAAREALDAVSSASPDALPAAPVVINFGNVQQAIDMSKQMHADNPYGDGLTFQTAYYSIAGEFDRALQAAEIAQSNGKIADFSRLGVYHAKNGAVDTAAEMFAVFLPIWRFDSALARPYADSIASGRLTEEFWDALDVANPALDANSIFFHVYIGSPADTVFELANRLYDEKRLNIIALYEYWASDYRADPRFIELVDRMGLLDYWRVYGAPDFCQFVDDELDCR